MNNWKTVWDVREEDESHSSILKKLIAADGFDTGYGTITEVDWEQYIDNISNTINVQKKDSVFEVGCGAGAFLYKFHQKGNKVGGIDYSDKLINIAKKYLANGSFVVDEANNLDVKEKYDFLISNSVFFYFPSYQYAEEVLKKMVSKSTKCIAVLEINDLAQKEKSMMIRKGCMSDQEYERKYKGLEHLYFERDWFRCFAEKNNLRVEIQQQDINNYQNNQYRFNVYMWKK